MTTAMIKVNGEVAEGAQLALRYLTRWERKSREWIHDRHWSVKEVGGGGSFYYQSFRFGAGR